MVVVVHSWGGYTVDKVSPCSLSVYHLEEDGALPKIKNLMVLEEPRYILYITLHEIEDAATRRLSSTLKKTTSRLSLYSLSLSFSLVTRSPFGYIQLNRVGMLSHRLFECDRRVPSLDPPS